MAVNSSSVLVAFLCLVPTVFYIIALATNRGVSYDGTNLVQLVPSGPFYNAYFTVNLGYFKSSVHMAYPSAIIDGDNSITLCTGSDNLGSPITLYSNSNCDKLKTGVAFTVMAVIIVGFTTLLSLCVPKKSIVCTLLVISGIFGLIGWALVCTVLKSFEAQTLGNLLTDANKITSLSIAYSQALGIVAWILCLVLAVVSAKLLPSDKTTKGTSV